MGCGRIHLLAPSDSAQETFSGLTMISGKIARSMRRRKAASLLYRQESRRADLPHVADLLHRSRAGEIDEAMIDDPVSLSWLEWLGGSFQMTTTAGNICRPGRVKQEGFCDMNQSDVML